jgi:hypothetical protein
MTELYYFGTSTTTAGHYFWTLSERMESSRMWFRDIPFNPEQLLGKRQVDKGQAFYFQIEGYSIIHIEGSPYDKRGGSKSVFWVHGDVPCDVLVALIGQNEPAKKLISAMPFEVIWP